MQKLTRSKAFFLSLTIFMVSLLMLVFSNGCSSTNLSPEEQSIQIDHVLERTDMYYSAIKAIIMEPDINILFTKSQLKDLEKIEIVYLAARDTAKNLENSTDPIQIILTCGFKALDVLTQLDIIKGRKQEVLAIRAVLLILKATLVPVELNLPTNSN